MIKTKNEELNRPSLEEFKKMEKSPFIFLLDNVRSALNVGSIFRTADAFSASGIYLCGITASPPNRDIEKTSLGSVKSVDWKYFNTSEEAVQELKRNNFTILAVEQAHQSVSLNAFHPEKEKKYAFIFGHEVFGVEEKLMKMTDGCIEIPQSGTKHSLNVAVSAGIIAWDFFAKRSNQGIEKQLY